MRARSTAPPDPRCWFCHDPIPAYGYHRVWHTPTIEGACIAVCSPDCPKLPFGVIYLGPATTPQSQPPQPARVATRVSG